MVAKRNQFPLVSSCSITVHKSQGASFGEVVYEYEKAHRLSLVYVALSRVTSIDGLYIVPKGVEKKEDFKFYHGRSLSVSMQPLQAEFRRLSANRLDTTTNGMLNFLDSNSGIILYSLNCQSLRSHADDLTDKVVQQSKILLLSEIWIGIDDRVDVANFNCIVQFRRKGVQAGGVAIYQNKKDTTNILTPSVKINLQNPELFNIPRYLIGDLCAAEYVTTDRGLIILVSVYISVNQIADDIINFIYEALFPYTVEGAAEFETQDDKVPMIMSGDFNINFNDDKSRPLVDFLRNTLSLTMSNDPTGPTTIRGTTIDASFSRFLGKIESKMFISYFSYHLPIISVVPQSKPLQIEEVNYE